MKCSKSAESWKMASRTYKNAWCYCYSRPLAEKCFLCSNYVFIVKKWKYAGFLKKSWKHRIFRNLAKNAFLCHSCRGWYFMANGGIPQFSWNLVKFTKFHQIQWNLVNFMEFHHFWWINAVSAPRLRMLCFSNRNQWFPGPFHVKSPKICDFTKFWWFWAISAHFMFSG